MVESWKAMAVPESATVCGLPGALSVTLSVPLAEPARVGAKLTLTTQLAPAGIVMVQVLDTLVKPAPLTAILVMERVSLPVLVSTTGTATLVVPTGTSPKLMLLVENDSTGA